LFEQLISAHAVCVCVCVYVVAAGCVWIPSAALFMALDVARLLHIGAVLVLCVRDVERSAVLLCSSSGSPRLIDRSLFKHSRGRCHYCCAFISTRSRAHMWRDCGVMWAPHLADSWPYPPSTATSSICRPNLFNRMSVPCWPFFVRPPLHCNEAHATGNSPSALAPFLAFVSFFASLFRGLTRGHVFV
jgi:hypothetical protein